MVDAQVLVVGAGPAGAKLSFLLASRGVDTLLVERQTDFERAFRGEVLMPSGLAALAVAGIELDAIPHRSLDCFRVYLRRRPVFEQRIEAADSTPQSVSQPQLLEHLVARAARTGHFELQRGAALRDLLHDGQRICGARVQTREGVRERRCRLLVGADGRASTVRRRLSPSLRVRGAPMDVVWCKLPWPAFFAPGEVRATIGGGHLLIALPAPDGLLQVAWVILKGSYGALRSRGIEAWVQLMMQHLDDELAAHLRATQAEITRPWLLDAQTDCVRGWAQAGALLIGDAAHTMSPVGGQGLNLALRDAVVAANHLLPALRCGVDLDVAAARVEAERRPEIDAIQRLAALPPRIVMGRRPQHTLARALLVHLAQSTFGQQQARRVVNAFLHGVTKVELRV